MAHADLIDSLIKTYRDLNLKLRPMTEEQLRAGTGGESLRGVLSDMRQRELVSSQQLKLMFLAEAAGTDADTVDPNSIEPPDSLSTKGVMSEFGTARESILAVVREMSEEAAARQLPSPDGPMSIETFITRLVDRDKQDMARIEKLLGGAA